MEDSWKKTGRVLVSAGLVTDELLERAEQAQKKVRRWLRVLKSLRSVSKTSI